MQAWRTGAQNMACRRTVSAVQPELRSYACTGGHVAIRCAGENLSGSPAVEHSAHVHAFDHAFVHFTFDGQRHELRRDGAPVALEPRAIAVLQDLLLHAGELRSREALLDAVWGHRHVTPDVLNRCIAQLRRALDDPAGQPHFIQTVHRLGYRFVGDVRLEPADANGDAGDGGPRDSDFDGEAAAGRRLRAD